jgi:hypothetical protein
MSTCMHGPVAANSARTRDEALSSGQTEPLSFKFFVSNPFFPNRALGQVRIEVRHPCDRECDSATDVNLSAEAQSFKVDDSAGGKIVAPRPWSRTLSYTIMTPSFNSDQELFSRSGS